MKASIRQRYKRWLSFTPAGYGARPHGSAAKRREGYPNDLQPSSTVEVSQAGPAGFMRDVGAASRLGSQRAADAASRPVKPAPGSPLFPYADSAQ
jgi:hypothetical protein